MSAIRSTALRASAVGLLFALGVSTSVASAGLKPSAVSDLPISPLAQGQAYRHGVVPMRPGTAANGYLTSAAASASGLLRAGAAGGALGVSTSAPRVYLVFWGSQWGAQSTDSQGYVTLSGDPNGAAPLLQAFFKGLGTGGELWSGAMTQYCQGVQPGATSCPAAASHVSYPAGGALAGVWVDDAAAAPAQATAGQIAAEAVQAAGHFGNTAIGSNRDAQYVIVSPTGAEPDGFDTATGAFCAWHDYTTDPSLAGGAAASPDGPIVFANMPYVTDAGAGCGEDFVSPSPEGTDDGFTIVAGQMYAEMLTDRFPDAGWTDASGNENANKCAWIGAGPGASQDITLATGTFAVSSTWANDFGATGGCEVDHPIVTGAGTGSITVVSPDTQTGTVGTATSVQVSASDSASGQSLSYRAAGLPAGLTIDPATGLISGTPRAAGNFTATVTATDTSGASASTSFTWMVNPASGGGCTAEQLLGDAGFETGSLGPWSATPNVLNNSLLEAPRSGAWDAWLGGYGYQHTDTLSQTVTLPPGCATYNLSFWLHVDTAETDDFTEGTLQVQLLGADGNVLTTLATYTNLDATPGYIRADFNLAAFAGQKVTLELTCTEVPGEPTSFVVDDFALIAAPSWIRRGFVTLTDPGRQSGAVGTEVSLPVHATDSASAQTPTYSAAGLPAGLSINSGTGLISGTLTTAGLSWVMVNATDTTTGASRSAWFPWRVAAPSSG